MAEKMKQYEIDRLKREAEAAIKKAAAEAERKIKETLR
jgi:hypothetical protein